MDIVQRLKQYMTITGLPTTQFADAAQIPRPTLSQILNGRNKKISHELLEKLHEGFPKLNILWLVFGDGQPEIDANIETSAPQNAPSLFDESAKNTDIQEFTPPVQEKNTHKNPYQSTEDQQNSAQDTERSISFDDVYPQNQKQGYQQQPLSASNAPKVPATILPDASKKIRSILVFYDDNSFETFTPAPM